MKDKKKIRIARLNAVLNVAFIYACVYAEQALAWVGAEYLFDGVVTPSRVDSCVNGLLAWFTARQLIQWLSAFEQARRKGGATASGEAYGR